jgi:hypothetical protein
MLLAIHLHCKQNDDEMVGWYFVDSKFVYAHIKGANSMRPEIHVNNN